MNSKAIPILLVLIMLTVATGVSAEGQAKTGVCHLDEDGNYLLISIADPAVEAHLAHGDVRPGEGGLDENCEPETQQFPGGCKALLNGLYVDLTGGTVVEHISGRMVHYESACQPTTLYFDPGHWTFWLSGITWADALAQCESLSQEAGYTGQLSETATDGLLLCFPVE